MRRSYFQIGSCIRPATIDYRDHYCQPADVRVSVDDVGL